MNIIFNMLNKFFGNSSILKIIKYYNLIILVIYVLGSIAFVYDLQTYQSLYKILSAILGFNLFSLIPNGYIVNKFNFCDWSKMAFISNVVICLLELLFSVLEMFIEIKWDVIIMLVISSILLTFTTKYFKWK